MTNRLHVPSRTKWRNDSYAELLATLRSHSYRINQMRGVFAPLLRMVDSWPQAAVEAAVSDNARVMALAGAAEHIAAGAPLYHPGMRDASMLTVRAPNCQLQRVSSTGKPDIHTLLVTA